MTASIAEIHPELFHYTGMQGLGGILEQQTLWATHSAFLKDTAEIVAFQSRLPRFLEPKIREALEVLIQASPDNQSLVDQHGGISAFAGDLAFRLTKGTFNALLGTGDTRAFAEPFILSFCTPATSNIAQHGLLSQWRGYGPEGGVAIVFDTRRLFQLLEEEGKRWKYDLFGGDVVYSSASDEEVLGAFGNDIGIITTTLANYVKTMREDEIEHIYYPIIRCACNYKHWGFYEEREVRIIAIPPNRQLFEEQRTRGLVETEKPRHHFVRAGSPVPCIHLLEGITSHPDKTLPITRIIVGPHREKDSRRVAIEHMVHQYGLSIPVTVSDIPYVG